MISGRGKNGLSTEVTAENHEHVLVLADELLPHLLAVVAFEFQLIGGSCLIPLSGRRASGQWYGGQDVRQRFRSPNPGLRRGGDTQERQ